MNAQQVKEQFRREGRTFSQWAQENGFPVWLVYRVLNGMAKGKYGKGHACAVALGLK